LTCVVVLKTLWHYRASVWSWVSWDICDNICWQQTLCGCLWMEWMFECSISCLCAFSPFCMIQTQTVQQTTKQLSCTGKTAENTRRRWQLLCKLVGMMTTRCCRLVLNSCTKVRELHVGHFSACHYLKIISSCDVFGMHVAPVWTPATYAFA